ncbi:MAG: hypothetical protein BMS9Abin02_1810 [Anaerolineae bacterium]|nr:MAG: hypothetical protein BMS9Abin02_1810 [Anaerolineae bacterium]
MEYTGNEVDIAFQFDLAKDIVNTSSVGLGSLYVQELSPIVEKFPKNQYATFITNHDQNRVMSELDGDNQAAKVAASLLLTGPGVPFIYYGEEIGMMGVKPDEYIRRPMQMGPDSPMARPGKRQMMITKNAMLSCKMQILIRFLIIIDH